MALQSGRSLVFSPAPELPDGAFPKAVLDQYMPALLYVQSMLDVVRKDYLAAQRRCENFIWAQERRDKAGGDASGDASGDAGGAKDGP